MNLSSLSAAATKAVGLSNLILVTPDDIGYQPQNPNNKDGILTDTPKSFFFHYEGDNGVSLESDITDHYIEDNTAIQDQISLKPEIFTTQGFIGELNDVVPAALKPLKFIANKLSAVEGLKPQLNPGAQIVYNNAFQLYQAGQNIKNNVVSTWNTINGLTGASIVENGNVVKVQNQNKQQVAFMEFYGYWKERRLFTIQTPWAIFKNMAILNLKANQSGETRVITDFEVTFKSLRFAESLSEFEVTAGLFNSQNFVGRAFNQGAKLVDMGSSAPQPSAVSLTSKLSGLA